MSKLSFLENAKTGENSWWRYLLTVFGSLGLASIAAGVLIAIVAAVYTIFYFPGITATRLNTLISISNPLFLILLTGVTYAFAFILFYLFIRFLHHKNFKILLNYGENFRWKMLFKGAFLWFLILCLLTLPDLLVNPGVYQFSPDFRAFSILLILSFLAFPVQATFEEILFRGYLMQGFSLISKKPVVPLLVTSLLFGLVHFFNGGNTDQGISIVLSTFIIGLMLGTITLADNGIETAVGVHIVNNLFVAIIFNSADSGLPGLPSLITAPSSNPYTGIPFLVLAMVLMIVISYWNRKNDLMAIFSR
ncbi:MAG TPA: type II CAAX endopeptidase family protein [Methanobacteriaceae archaeon]|nr:type II CAAX endopeptidase family protein [Methanobacteriaceae archaeon]